MTEQPKGYWKNWEDSIHYDSSKWAKELAASDSFLCHFIKTSSAHRQMEFLIRNEISPANSSGPLLIEHAEYSLRTRKTSMDMMGLGYTGSLSPVYSSAVPALGKNPSLSQPWNLSQSQTPQFCVIFLNRLLSKLSLERKMKSICPPPSSLWKFTILICQISPVPLK